MPDGTPPRDLPGGGPPSEGSAPGGPRRRPWLRALLIGLLTGALLFWFLYRLDFREVWGHLRSVRALPLFLSFLFAMLHLVLRAWRWRFLLRPVGEAPFGARLVAVTVGYAVNNILPGRVGEVARPVLLARRTDLPLAGLLGTVVLERFLDAAAICFLFFASLPLLLPRIAEEAGEAAVGQGLAAAALLAVLAGGAFLALRLLAGTGRAATAALRLLPARLRERARSAALSFHSGFGSVARWPLLLWVALSSLAVWLDIALGIWFGVLAFGVSFPVGGAVFLMAWLALGISLPTPAGVGGYHKAGQLALHTAFGFSLELSAGIALVLHAVSVVPVTLLGLALLGREGVRLRELRAQAASPSGRLVPAGNGVAGPGGRG